VKSSRAAGQLSVAPAIVMEKGELVRPSPFSTADAVFTGTPAEVVRRFIDATGYDTYSLFDRAGSAGSAASVDAALAVKALVPGLTVLLEGGLARLDECLALAERGLLPVADERLLADSPVRPDSLPKPVYLGLAGDDDGLFERVARAVERGFWGVVHHSNDPAKSCALAARLGGRFPFWSREPFASPAEVERVIDHHRRLFSGGVPAVIVDGEWFVDYNSFGAPFDLL